MRRFFLTLITIGIASFCYASSAHAADGLQIRPLMYHKTLTIGQTERGVVDVANASDTSITVRMSVRLFRQVADDGSLQFYDAPYIKEAIVPDLQSFKLDGKGAMRVGFSVDSTKLPSGDIFAAIFAMVEHNPVPQAIVPAVQVGTLLIFQNGTSGPRNATITQLDVSPFQFGTAVKATVSIHNDAKANMTTGFFPSVTAQLRPWGSQTKLTGPLVYAGRTRTFDVSVPSDQFGVYALTVHANNATRTTYVFVMTGRWRVIVPGIMVILIILTVGLLLWRSKHRHTRKPLAR